MVWSAEDGAGAAPPEAPPEYPPPDEPEGWDGAGAEEELEEAGLAPPELLLIWAEIWLTIA